jgi:hypothetical protein
MEQQLANVSMPLASIIFDLIQHCPAQSLRSKYQYAATTNGVHQRPLRVKSGHWHCEIDCLLCAA